MTGWRTSVGFKFEDTFGVEAGTPGQGFKYLGPGLTFNYTANNQIKYTFTLGSKFYDVANAAKFSGTWSVDVLLDYDNFEWLAGVFEEYHYDITNNVHVFTKSNRKTIKSMSIKGTKLNRIVGGNYDQQVVLVGCLITSMTANYESQSASTVRCKIGGMYVNESQVLYDLDDTEFDEMAPENKIPVEWGCLQVPPGTPIANNEKTGISISQNVSTLPTCGSRFDSAYYEGQVQPISVTTSVYSRNPAVWYLRMYSGGYDNTIADNSASPSSNVSYSPYPKQLKPVPLMAIASSDSTGAYTSTILLTDVMVESLAQTYSSSNEIVDAPTLKAKGVTIQMKTPDITQNLFAESLGVYTISFSAGTGSGTPPTSTQGSPGDTFILPSGTSLTPPASSAFAGWTCEQYPNKVFNSGETFTIPKLSTGTTVTLTATYTTTQ